MELSEQTVRQFAHEVSSDSPAPGGGSVSALAGAMGAALTAMVSGLTAGKKQYAHVQELVLAAQNRGTAIEKKLLEVMEQDTEAFLKVSAAYAMPKETEHQKAARSEAIQQALKGCTEPPFQAMRLCGEGLCLMEHLLGNINTAAASDFGVAALMYKAAMQGAWLNVQINLASIKDTAFTEAYRKEGKTMLAEYLPKADQLFDTMAEVCDSV